MRGRPWISTFSRFETDIARSTICKWQGYAPTPLISLSPLARDLRVAEIILKDEGSRFGVGSFKALGAAYAMQRWIDDQAFSRVSASSVVCCASDGNYGAAVAWAAGVLGIRSVVYLPAHVTDYRERAIRSYGARTVRVNGTYDAAVIAARRNSLRHQWTLFSDVSSHGDITIPRNVMVGYSTMLSEIAEVRDLHQITHIFVQCGVGTFAAAICEYLDYSLPSNSIKIITVEPVRAACALASIARKRRTVIGGDLGTIMGGLACGRLSPMAWKILRQRSDYSTAIRDVWALSAMRTLADRTRCSTPVRAGETGAAGLAGLLALDAHSRQQIGLAGNSRVLLFCTEGVTDPNVYDHILNEGAAR